MTKKNEIKEEREEEVLVGTGNEESSGNVVPKTNRIAFLTAPFSNGELNILRDKINELIARS